MFLSFCFPARHQGGVSARPGGLERTQKQAQKSTPAVL